ncbi:hypothetical protein HK096_006475 [Nowakowskiella sp. JEL0078]|nr:hypothetical protein HK096_006475 [Nowakowskiella sp. JEL0078]
MSVLPSDLVDSLETLKQPQSPEEEQIVYKSASLKRPLSAVPKSDFLSKRPRQDDSTNTVADHYNARPNQGRNERRGSPIFRLRGFNNWIKSILISKYAKSGDFVLDMCCGKGGDLEKFSKADIRQLLGLDVAEQSVRHARDRYRSKRYAFRADFHSVDCFGSEVNTYFPPDIQFDLVTIQFALHYSFQNEQRARQALTNLSSRMKKGAIFLGTIPDALWIV